MNEKRYLQTVAPFLAHSLIDVDFDTNKYAKFLVQNARRLGTFKKYLICKFHDSAVIEMVLSGDILKISLNDFSIYVFACALIEKYHLPVDPDSISFPVTLEFTGNLTVGYNTVDDEGLLTKMDAIDVDRYLYEQVTKVDHDHIEIVFHFWKSNSTQNTPGSRVIVVVAARILNLTENQDRGWIETFGHDYDELFKYFKKRFDGERYVSDHHECLMLIKEFEQTK